jgi:pyruvate dehydrogenase E1 component beta subunit
VIDPHSRSNGQGADHQSVIKPRALVVHEAPITGGFGGEVVARIASSRAFDYLEAPVRRLAGLDIPIPYNRNLERHAVPQVDNIIEEARKLVRGEY